MYVLNSADAEAHTVILNVLPYLEARLLFTRTMETLQDEYSIHA